MAFWKKQVEEDLEEVDFYEILKRDRAAKKAAEAQALEDAKSPEEKAREEAQREAERKLAEDRLMAERARKLVEKAKRAEAEKLAEQQRLEEEKRKAEEERIAEETRLAEEVRKIEEERILEEARMREEAARRVEEERLAEEARIREEAARRAEEERIAEEARIREEAIRRLEEARMREEAARRAEEERLVEEARIHEEAVRRAEEARRLEEARMREEALRRAEEERVAEEARMREEALRRAEEERIAEEARIREEAARRAEVRKEDEAKEEIVILEISAQDMRDPHLFLGKQDKTYALGWHIENGEVDAFFYSRSNEIRAVEFMEFLVMEYGKASGNSTYAQAKLPSLLFKVLAREVNKDSVEAFLNAKVQEYYKECDWLYTEGMVDSTYLEHMPQYKKKYIPWAYVKTTDIIPRGEKFRMKMLENESEVEMIADDDVYIMIGIKGEIYSISADKFDVTYKQTFELFDIYDIMPMYLPTVYACVTNKRISLGDKAHLCYPRNNNTIYAKQLERKTKVFTKYNKGEYFVGKPGDYLVVRADDLEDVYVIQKEIFGESYEKAIDV